MQDHVSHSLNSLKRGYIGAYIGDYYKGLLRGILGVSLKGDYMGAYIGDYYRGY